MLDQEPITCLELNRKAGTTFQALYLVLVTLVIRDMSFSGTLWHFLTKDLQRKDQKS